MSSSPVSPRPLNTTDAEIGIRLVDALNFARRNWRTASLVSLATFLLTGVVLLVLPREYEAAATLVVVPPRFTSELKPPTLTVQGYQKLLESDEVISETKKRLVASGTLASDEVLDLGEELTTRIFVSRRAEETSLAPMVEAVVQWDDPDTAAEISNTWAQIFLERTQELIRGTTSITTDFIDAQYTVARADLRQLEEELRTTQDDFRERLDEISTMWDGRIVEHRNTTEDQLAAFRSETKRILEDFRTARNLETRRAQLSAMRNAYADLQNEQSRVNSELQRMELRESAARKQLEQTPMFFTLRKAITDDALWQAIVGAGRTSAVSAQESLQDKALVTQELNPVYVEINSSLAEIEMEVNSLEPRHEQLAVELESLSSSLRELEVSLGLDDIAMKRLQEERNSGLSSLTNDRERGLRELERSQDREIAAVTREQDATVERIRREIAVARSFFNDLAENFNQSTIAKAQQDVEDVRLGSRAVAPEQPLRRHAAIKLITAAVLGLGLGIVAAGIRELAGTQ